MKSSNKIKRGTHIILTFQIYLFLIFYKLYIGVKKVIQTVIKIDNDKKIFS